MSYSKSAIILGHMNCPNWDTARRQPEPRTRGEAGRVGPQIWTSAGGNSLPAPSVCCGCLAAPDEALGQVVNALRVVEPGHVHAVARALGIAPVRSSALPTPRCCHSDEFATWSKWSSTSSMVVGSWPRTNLRIEVMPITPPGRSHFPDDPIRLAAWMARIECLAVGVRNQHGLARDLDGVLARAIARVREVHRHARIRHRADHVRAELRQPLIAAGGAAGPIRFGLL